jgi:hypothetical protein
MTQPRKMHPRTSGRYLTTTASAWTHAAWYPPTSTFCISYLQLHRTAPQIENWLLDRLYATHRGDEVSIHRHGQSSQCEVAYEDHVRIPLLFPTQTLWGVAKLRTELYAPWSSLGTYTATPHRQGIGLYGGPSFQLQARFFHLLIRLIDLWPCEQYLVTWSHEPIVVAAEDMPLGPRFFSADEGSNIAI